jgi:hypothetical protein
MMRPILKAGAEYFAAVFAAGFLMGTIRTIAIAPRIGELYAVVAEAALSVSLNGRSLSQHIALYLELPVQIGLLGQILFALRPFMRARASAYAAVHAPGNKGSQL